MADFVPTTTIYFFLGTGVTPQNQPYFTSQGAKMAWYMAHTPITFEEYSYQRENRQYIKVNAKAADMRKYDMLAFRNDPADRWIICRVLEVEFVNPNTTRVTFETDSMQTFIEDIKFEMSWVEREMQDEDWVGAYPNFNNLMPEGIEVGAMEETILENPTIDISEPGTSMVVMSVYDANAEPNYNTKVEGPVKYGLNTIIVDTAASMDSLLTLYQEKGKLDGIIGVWLVPKQFVNYSESTYTISQPTNIGSYTPKNAKVLSSEFCDITISNRQGVSVQLQPEFLFTRSGAGGSRNAVFTLCGGFLAGGGGIILYPNDYMKGTLDANTVKDYGVVLPLNIQTAYIGDTFANWVAQNRGALLMEGVQGILTAVGGVASIGVGLVTGNPLSIGSGAKTVAGSLYNGISTMTKLYDKSTHPAGAFGQVSAQSLMLRSQQFGFNILYRHPTVENAKAIDDFFSVFGYRTCRMKVPNVNTRPFWNYVKCNPGVVRGPFSSADNANIVAVLNAGVTFWNCASGVEIGDYSRDNRG